MKNWWHGFSAVASTRARSLLPHALLDDQRPHGLTQRNGGMPPARLEACRVPDLSGTPVDPPGENAPFVAGVELHPAGLAEVVEGKLAVAAGLYIVSKRGEGQGKLAWN